MLNPALAMQPLKLPQIEFVRIQTDLINKWERNAAVIIFAVM